MGNDRSRQAISPGIDRPGHVNAPGQDRPGLVNAPGQDRPFPNVLGLGRSCVFMPLGLNRPEHVNALIAGHAWTRQCP